MAIIPNPAIIHVKRSVFPKGGSTTENNTLIVLSRYVVIDILKSGTDTNVFLVRHPTTEQKLIIKQIRISTLSAERFRREIHTLKHLKNPHIPLLYDIQKDNDYYYIVEEYFEGVSLKSVIDKGTLSANIAIRYTIQLCDILKYLHEHSDDSILYLDCRPDNIIISPDENVNLIDFGSSMRLSETASRSTCYGSVGFAAPELYTPHSFLSSQTDVYGVGALLYYMLTGTVPSNSLNLHKNKIPTKLLNIIRKCLRHRPGARYLSIDDLKTALIKLNTHTKSSKKIENTSLTISIAGSDRRVGVTHLAMSLANYLNNSGFQTFIKDMNTPDMISVLKDSDECHYLQNDYGLFKYRGITFIPTFNETIDLNEQILTNHTHKPVVYINDCGMISNTSDTFNSADICLFVGSGKPWEIKNLLNTMHFCEKNKTFFIVNLMDGTTFYRLIKSQTSIFMRMPYYYDWHSPGMVGKRFLEELTDEIKKRWKE